MTGFLFKWLFIPVIFIISTSDKAHPVFVSVTEIEHNQKEKTLEISCKIFTDDFEKTLRKAYKTRVDLADEKNKPAMDKLVNDYVQKHLKITVNGSAVNLRYVGYEIVEEGVISYLQAYNIASVKKINVTDNILFEYKNEQINILHITVSGKRQSTKLNNPDDKVEMVF
jgi:hypothetical protein